MSFLISSHLRSKCLFFLEINSFRSNQNITFFRYKLNENKDNCALEAHNCKDCTENTIISIIDTNFKNNQKKNVASIKNA